MLSDFARLLLISTSVAPIAIVYGFASLPEHWVRSLICLGASLFLVGLCRAMLAFARRHIAPEWIEIKEIELRDSDVLAFLVAYALPLVAQEPSITSVYALLAFAVLMAIVLAKCNLFHVNPLLGMLGFHFFSVKTAAGMPILIISDRRERLGLEKIRVVRLSPVLFLEKPK